MKGMMDPPIGKNPVAIIRYRNKDGEFLYSREECERLLELYLDRAKKLWEEEAKTAQQNGPILTAWKETGRGRLFWIDSE
jgi:hypothetical protein